MRVKPSRVHASRLGRPMRLEPSMVLAADYPFLDILWSMIIFFTLGRLDLDDDHDPE